VTLARCHITNSIAFARSGGGIYLNLASLRLEVSSIITKVGCDLRESCSKLQALSVPQDSIIDGNTASGARAGGIYCDNAILFSIIRTVAMNNGAKFGGGVYAVSTVIQVETLDSTAI
jgi:hypothetical protein